MTRKRTRKGATERRVSGLKKKGTYDLNEWVATELEIYGIAGTYGAKNKIVEEGVKMFLAKNKIDKSLYEAAKVIALRKEAN